MHEGDLASSCLKSKIMIQSIKNNGILVIGMDVDAENDRRIEGEKGKRKQRKTSDAGSQYRCK